MMNLTTRQEGILKGLLNDLDWVDLLNQLEAEHKIKPWRSGKNEDDKHSQWIYDSGRQRGISDILTILRLTT